MVEMSVGAVLNRALWRDLRVKCNTIAASEAANEGVWMKEFISDLGVIPSGSGPTKYFVRNIGAIALAKESRFHKKTKHI